MASSAAERAAGLGVPAFFGILGAGQGRVMRRSPKVSLYPTEEGLPMSTKPIGVCLCALVLLAGCAELDNLLYGPAKPAATSSQAGAGGDADAVYINPQAQAAAANLRNVYIAPANFANMQVIQPEGAAADGEWWITEEENRDLQAALTYEFAIALAYQSAFNVVYNPGQADVLLETSVVAVHPDETRGSVARRTTPGGAITVSIAAVNARSKAVMIRTVDTLASDDVWAFNQAKKDDPALAKAFRAWGDAVRRALLKAQGRPGA
jgi:Protein of unknown function (DUF3313)